MRLRRKRVNLVERLRPHIGAGEPVETMVSADHIRMFIYRWMIETGDPIEVVARGFDVDVELISSIVSGDRGFLARHEANRLRSHFGLEDAAHDRASLRS